MDKKVTKERAIKIAISGYMRRFGCEKFYANHKLPSLVEMANKRKNGDTLLDFLILELNDCLADQPATNMLDQAGITIDAAIEDLLSARRALSEKHS